MHHLPRFHAKAFVFDVNLHCQHYNFGWLIYLRKGLSTEWRMHWQTEPNSRVSVSKIIQKCNESGSVAVLKSKLSTMVAANFEMYFQNVWTIHLCAISRKTWKLGISNKYLNVASRCAKIDTRKNFQNSSKHFLVARSFFIWFTYFI